MLKLLTNFESVAITLNIIDAKTSTYGLTVMPKLKAPLVITFKEDEIDEVERQIEDYLTDAESIVNASNIASVKGANAKAENTKDKSAKDAKGTKVSVNPVAPAAPKTKADKPKQDATTSAPSNEQPTTKEEKKDEAQDFTDLLLDLGI